MAVGGLNVEDGDLGLGPGLAGDLEELALAVVPTSREMTPDMERAGGAVSDLQPCADAGKLVVEQDRVHAGETRLGGHRFAEIESETGPRSYA